MDRRRLQVGALLATVVLLLSSAAGWAAYPERPIRFIVPWAAGGDTDAIMRVVARGLEKDLGVPVVVTNIPGASGTVGAREAKAAPADGYTVFAVHDSIHTTFYTGVAEVNYWDYTPVCLITSTPSIVATHPLRWRAMKELIEDARKRPDEVKAGATLGSTSHFFLALIERKVGARLWRYVHYEGTAPRMTALMGGHIDVAETNLTQIDKMRGGQMRLLAIATDKRHPEARTIPTLKELGIDVVYAVNRGLVVPRGTPEPAVARLEQACEKVARDSAFAEAMRLQGTDVRFLNRQQYTFFLRENDALNKGLADALGYRRR
ncbi:MAG: tripartite tricarboxylate transporter substrate binding protein [Armatimonadota bacterium]|nr:tripartite tricarboxylate transporter substrate binding protein [Armatimonadota bacterium]MDR7485682.1 tripartite tricarboxylate transporter substrate binding protein [Armatimonadota bacterium]MDR7533075.1 tripartite tricarboxylate transporter substrate binding protein [Armatimonadota bacterium]MDR7535893.1 tripartite tricarboxylate transporter substrate binding protein [Armatimonadota bacterium]